MHQTGFEPVRLSPEDLKPSLLDLAPALMRTPGGYRTHINDLEDRYTIHYTTGVAPTEDRTRIFGSLV